MSVHHRFRALAAQAIDFDLPERDRAHLDAHLESCPQCRSDERRLRGDAMAIARLPAFALPQEMRARFATTWAPRASDDRQGNLRLLIVLATLLALGAGVAIAAGRAFEWPPARIVAPPDEPGLPMVGNATSMPISAGAGANEGLCTLREGGSCATDVLVAFGSAWVTAVDRVVRVDEATGDVVAEIALPSQPVRLASDGERVWVTTHGPSSITAIDPRSNAIVRTIEIDGLPAGIAVHAGHLWVVDSAGTTVARVDPSAGMVLDAIDVGRDPWEIAATRGAIWVTDRHATRLVMVEPTTRQVVNTFAVPGASPTNWWSWGDGVVTDGNAIYLGSGAAISKFDLTSAEFTTTPAPLYSHLAVADGRVWRVAGAYGVLEELDPISLEAIASQHLDIGSSSVGGDWETSVAVTPSAIWIRSYGDEVLIRVSR